LPWLAPVSDQHCIGKAMDLHASGCVCGVVRTCSVDPSVAGGSNHRHSLCGAADRYPMRHGRPDGLLQRHGLRQGRCIHAIFQCIRGNSSTGNDRQRERSRRSRPVPRRVQAPRRLPAAPRLRFAMLRPGSAGPPTLRPYRKALMAALAGLREACAGLSSRHGGWRPHQRQNSILTGGGSGRAVACYFARTPVRLAVSRANPRSALWFGFRFMRRGR
jgi:hypothetical protein